MKKTAEKNRGHAHKTKKTHSHEDTQVAAYYEWQKRGEPFGEDFTDWDVAQQHWEDEENDPLEIIGEEFN
jgi:hypothetical protein